MDPLWDVGVLLTAKKRSRRQMPTVARLPWPPTSHRPRVLFLYFFEILFHVLIFYYFS